MSLGLESRLKDILLNSVVAEVLPAIAEVELPDCWLAGGAIRNTVWRCLYQPECRLSIKDFDVVFFDPFGERQQEQRVKAALERQFRGEIFDVKNQASFGVWRPWRFSFVNTAHGVAHWLHTATAVGVRMDSQGNMEILAPYGLDDLFAGILRPSPANADSPDARGKAMSLLASCSVLRLAQPCQHSSCY